MDLPDGFLSVTIPLMLAMDDRPAVSKDNSTLRRSEFNEPPRYHQRDTVGYRRSSDHSLMAAQSTASTEVTQLCRYGLKNSCKRHLLSKLRTRPAEKKAD